MDTHYAPSGQANIYVAIIKATLLKTASWRELVGTEKWPNDHRNQHAAALLRALAAEPDPVLSDTALARISVCRGSLARHAKTASRVVGFKALPASLEDFIELILALHADEQARIAKVFSSVEAGR